ncbi:Eco57I restriction-modification methylase domain-containing protein, partial [Candidatus Methanocrinis natronophilus]
DDAIQEAKRDVLQSCIFGVDINPMAVELAKVSLWINAMVRDRPLNFLDHRIKPGNSLVGATPELIERGVPDGAFKPVTGDDKKVAKHFRDLNKRQRKNRSTIDAWAGEDATRRPGYAEKFASLSGMKEDSSEGVAEKCRTYRKLLETEELKRKRLEADAWTAAFFMPMDDEGAPFPTTAEVRRLGSEDVPEGDVDPLAAKVEDLAEKHRFFHWHLEFPAVFAAGGFDVVLGNPPWERIKLQEKEFFAAKDAEVANAPTAAARKRLIRRLVERNPALDAEYKEALRQSEGESRFIRDSGRFPMTGVGDVNTYAVFAELAQSAIRPEGRAGIIIPSGIATDYTYKDFFTHLIEDGRLVSLYDFENRERTLFADVYYRMRFCLLTTTGKGFPAADFAFFLHKMDDLADAKRHFSLNRDDLARINPNTKTCPIFRSLKDADLTLKMYEVVPVLINEDSGENPWEIRFSRMFDMTNDSDQFRTSGELQSKGFELKGNRLVTNDDLWLPLYEGRMIDILDHRLASTINKKIKLQRSAESRILNNEEKQNPYNLAMPRYWINSADAKGSIPTEFYSRGWAFGYMSITSATNARTAIASIIPLSGFGNSITALISNYSAKLQSSIAANFSCFVFDYICKQKVSGNNFNNFIVKQLPVLPPDRYTPELLDLIVPKVVELTYTAWDLEPFAQDILEEVGAETWNRWFPDNPLADGKPAPFRWDEDRRAALRAELDAIYAHLYGLTGEELDYILETFPIVKRKDVERYGSFRTKEMILERYGEYASFFDKTDGGAV